MDEELIKDIINEFPFYTTIQMLKEYNNRNALPPLSYSKFISLVPRYPDVYNTIMDSKETREAKMKIALQDSEDAMFEQAAMGDHKARELLLKSQSESYRDKKQLDIQISHSYQEQLNKLDIAITTNKLPHLEAEIVEE